MAAGGLLRKAEAAGFLKISESTLEKLTCRKQIPHVKIGRLVRYDLADLREWIARNRKAAPKRGDTGASQQTTAVKRQEAKSSRPAIDPGQPDDLATVIEAWDSLHENIRRFIFFMVKHAND